MEVLVKYWETEKEREQGVSEIHGIFEAQSKEELRKVIQEAKGLHKNMAAAVEVEETTSGKLIYHISDQESDDPYIEDNTEGVEW